MQSIKLVRNVYFVKFGTRTGQFFVIIDYNKDTKVFSILALPELECLYIKDDELIKHIKDILIDYVEKLPDNVYNDCKNQFLIAEKGK